MAAEDERHNSWGSPPTNAEIADKLLSLAQLLSAQKENPYKVKAYRRAAGTLRILGESIAEFVHNGGDLTMYPGIGEAIAGAIQEIVKTGTTQKIQTLESEVPPELAVLSHYPRLDPRRVLRINKKLGISTIDELRQRLESGEVGRAFGPRMDQHVRRALAEHDEILLSEADGLALSIQDFLTARCGASRAVPAGDYRRRLEVVSELHFLVETPSFSDLVENLQKFGGRTLLRELDRDSALFTLPSGMALKITAARPTKWGVAWIAATGSPKHVRELESRGWRLQDLMLSSDSYETEAGVYARMGLSFIPPELREGFDEIALAAAGRLPQLIEIKDIRGELHAHSTSSDGADSLEDMARAAQAKGLEYIGLTDHSQSLKVARGLPESRLRNQLRFIDKLNERLDGIRILKSAEVDILPDGSLDYPDELLKELDYTICSIHSQFGLGKEQQTNRILRAMDNPYFTFLGHATGRVLLKRPGYEIDIERVLEHARQNKCFLEVNSSPHRLDLSAEHARLAREKGVRVAVTTDAHSTQELDFIKFGIEQARRAGLDRQSTLNSLSWDDLRKAIQR